MARLEDEREQEVRERVRDFIKGLHFSHARACPSK